MPKPRRPITIGGRVVDGVLHLDSRNLFDAALKHADWQRRVVVTIAPEEKKRSLRANAYYRGVVLRMIADELGYEPDDLHECLLLKFSSKTVADPETGEEVRITQRSRTKTVDEFSAFLERVMLWAAEKLGMTFPEPRRDEEWREERAA